MIAFFDPSRASAAGLAAFLGFAVFLAAGFLAAGLACFLGLRAFASGEGLVPFLFVLAFLGAFCAGCAASAVRFNRRCGHLGHAVVLLLSVALKFPSHDDSSL
jgi:hypothetical protein